jgi:hypothetical protein
MLLTNLGLETNIRLEGYNSFNKKQESFDLNENCKKISYRSYLDETLPVF